MDLIAARLEGANLREAGLEEADLRGAGLKGADLIAARLQAADWFGATIGPSPAHSTNFSDGTNLTQGQLETVIGDEATILPRDAETGEPLHVWSCWKEEAAARFIEIWTAHRDEAPLERRQRMIALGLICKPENPRRPVGTPAEEPAPDGE